VLFSSFLAPGFGVYFSHDSVMPFNGYGCPFFFSHRQRSPGVLCSPFPVRPLCLVFPPVFWTGCYTFFLRIMYSLPPPFPGRERPFLRAAPLPSPGRALRLLLPPGQTFGGNPFHFPRRPAFSWPLSILVKATPFFFPGSSFPPGAQSRFCVRPVS